MSRRLLALALVLPVFGGCLATKRDVRELRAEVGTLRAAQDALVRELQRQHAVLLDSMATQDIRMRGDLLNRLMQVDRQLVQIQELTGQSQQRLSELRQELREREEATRAAAAAAAAANPDAPGASPEVGNPDELFTTAQAALQRGSLATARAGFEEFVRAFPQHARAAEAQLAIGETYEKGKELQRALDAYQRVPELYPGSPRAATALLRSAQIEEGRGNRDRARTLLNQLVTAYPRSPEATRAREQLERLRRR